MRHYVERDSLETVVTSRWLEILPSEPRDLDMNFFEAGGNSLTAVRFVTALNQSFPEQLSLRTFLEQPTIRGICAWLRTGALVRVGRLTTFREAGDGAPLVVVAGAGGGLVGMSGLHSPNFDRPTSAIRSRGLGEGETALESVAEIAEDMADVLDASDMPRRVHLAGMCSGGVVAYDLAPRLAARGWTVASVLLVNTRLCVPKMTTAEFVRQRVDELAKLAGIDPAHAGEMSLADLFGSVQQSGLDLVEDNADAFGQRLTVFASNAHAVSAYEPKPIDFPVTLLTCADRLEDHAEDCQANLDHPDWPDILQHGLVEIPVAVPHERIFRDAGVVTMVENALAAAESHA